MQDATSRYHESLPGSPAEEHLAGRGLLSSERMKGETAKFRLGYVEDPLPGHDMYKGMLAIPYLRKGDDGGWSVVSIRFRCIEDHDHKSHGKYMTPSGDTARLYNTLALLRPLDSVLLTEGELDTVTAQVYGFDSVAVPGASNWKPHYKEPLLGYQTVFILADGDEAGLKFAERVKADLPNGKVIPCPPGQDVNSWITDPEGYKAFKERIK